MIYSANESKTATAGATASEVALDMTPKRQYRITAGKADGLFYRMVKPSEATAVAAVGGDGSHYLPAGQSHLIAAIAERTRVSVIREGSTDTKATVSELPTVVAT